MMPELPPGRKYICLDENDPDERAFARGVVSSGRAVLDGTTGAPRIREDDVQLQMRRAALERLQETVAMRRLSGVEELLMLIRYLPESFVQAYLRLIDAAVGEKNLGSGRGYDENDMGLGARSGVQTKSESKDHRGSAVQKGRASSDVSGGMPLKSEARMRELDRYRKRLRGIAREIVVLLREDGEERPVLRRRCVGFCKRLGDQDDKFCRNCGSPMADVLPKEKK